MAYMLFVEYDVFDFPSILKIYEYHKGLYRSITENLENEFIDYDYVYCLDKNFVIVKMKELVKQFDLSVRDCSGTILAPEFYSCDSINLMMEQGVI